MAAAASPVAGDFADSGDQGLVDVSAGMVVSEVCGNRSGNCSGAVSCLSGAAASSDMGGGSACADPAAARSTPWGTLPASASPAIDAWLRSLRAAWLVVGDFAGSAGPALGEVCAGTVGSASWNSDSGAVEDCARGLSGESPGPIATVGRVSAGLPAGTRGCPASGCDPGEMASLGVFPVDAGATATGSSAGVAAVSVAVAAGSAAGREELETVGAGSAPTCASACPPGWAELSQNKGRGLSSLPDGWVSA